MAVFSHTGGCGCTRSSVEAVNYVSKEPRVIGFTDHCTERPDQIDHVFRRLQFFPL